MSTMYHVRVRGRTLGPYPLDAIRQMARRAQVGRMHEVSLDGMSWAPAGTFPEIFEWRSPGGAAPGAATAPAAGGTGSAAADQSRVWHYTLGGVQQPAPIDEAGLKSLIIRGQVLPDDHVWCEAMTEWAQVATVPELASRGGATVNRSIGVAGSHAHVGTSGGHAELSSAPFASEQSSLYRQFVAKKTVAGICGIFLGWLGVHKFVIGLTTGGLTMLLLCCLVLPIPVLSVIALIEAIIYLSKTDEQFFRDYAVDRKQWF